ncbi:MAG: polysaccharide biosynthesis tyrosine autokinase [Negativicutes bacterium]|nr:polysaccharide biosynthesis tyrosine autokinase [Negativicutes bacterium]
MINLIAKEDSKSPVTEAYRMIRTNIQFSNEGNGLKTIAFTSAGPNEGKSTVVANLAVVMAQAGHKVVLLDCDLRNPSVHNVFKLPNKGLSNCVMAGENVFDVVQSSDVQNLDILTSGPLACYPSELLGSKRMKIVLDELASKYDYILIDTPPVLAFTDAAVVAAKADGIILLMEWGKVKPALAKEAKKILEHANSNIIGVILNKVELDFKTDAVGYYHLYGQGQNEATGQQLLQEEAK